MSWLFRLVFLLVRLLLEWSIRLSLEITGGPTADSPVPYGSVVTLRWKASGGKGSYLYSYRLGTEGDFSPWSSSTSVSYATVDIGPGDHNFYVKVKTDKDPETQPIEHAFKVSEPETTPPEVEITYPWAGYKAATGSDILVNWTVTPMFNARRRSTSTWNWP